MTSYSQSDYYYNNENDALSCNSRPISSTIHRKSSNNYELHHPDTMYDSYGNSRSSREGVAGLGLGIDSIGSMSALADDTIYNKPPSIYDTTTNATNIAAATAAAPIMMPSTAARTRSAAGYSSTDCEYDYGLMTSSTTAYTTATTNDNMMYHRDIYSSYNIACSGDNMYDKSDYGGGEGGGTYDYWDNAIQQTCNGDSGGNGRHTSLGTTKMLPKLPIRHSSSMLDGMYSSNNLQRYDTRTPPVAQQHQQQLTTATTAKSRMLPLTGAAAAYNISSVGVVGGEIEAGYSLQYNQLNGHNNYVVAAVGGVDVAAAATVAAAGSGGVVSAGNGGGGMSLPPAPLRALPQPYMQQSHSVVLQRHKLFEDGTTAAATTNEMYIKSNYDNTTINNYNNYANTTTTAETTTVGGAMFSLPTANTAFDDFYHSMQQRPHTSMAPLNYSEDYSGYAYNSAENLSIYSDSAATSQQQQQKLQQHRKHSIIMAMTTASVIASGETRITPQQRKQQQQKMLSSTTTINNANTSSSNSEMRSSYAFESDNSGVVVPKRQQFGSIATTETTIMGSATSDMYNYEYMSRLNSSRYAATNPQKSTATNATALSSEMLSNMSMLSSAVTVSSYPLSSSPASSAMTTTAITTTTTRKLPKRLPTPKYKNTTTTTAAGSSSINGNNRINSNMCVKQLPKLPQPKVNVSNVSTTVADKAKLTEIKSTLTTPITTAPVAISLTSTSSSSLSPSATLSSIYATATNSASFSNSATLAATITTTTPCKNNIFSSCNKNSNNNNLIVNEDLSVRATINKSFALPISISSTSSLSSTAATTTTSLSAAYGAVDTIYNLGETSFTADKITTPLFDIADYLNPYALPTYCVSSNISSTYDVTAYELPPSSSSLYTSKVESISTIPLASSMDTTLTTATTMATTSSLSSTSSTIASVYAIKSTTTATTATTAILPSYNSSSFANDTASNFSNSSKLTNSSISKNLKSSDSFLDTLVTSVTATATSSSILSCTTAAGVATASSSSALNTNIMADLNGSRPPTTTASSSSLFLSSFDYKSNAYNDSSSSYNTILAENFPLDKITTTTTAAICDSLTTTPIDVTTSSIGNRFLNELHLITTSNNMPTTTTTTSSSTSYSTITATTASDLYSDYLKKFNLDNSSTKLTADKQQELPTYITDFLNCDYSSKYEPLTLEYKYEDYSAVDVADSIITSSTTSTIATTTSCNDYMVYTRKFSLKITDTTSTITTPAETTPFTVTSTNNSFGVTASSPKVETYIATQSEIFNDSNTLLKTQILADATTMFPSDSTMSFGNNNTATADTETETQLTVASATASPVFDDNFYDSYNVDLSTLTATSAITIADAASTAFNDKYEYDSILLPDINNSSYLTTVDYSLTEPTVTSSVSTTASAHLQEHHRKFDTATSIATTTSIGDSDFTATATTQGGYYKPASTAGIAASTTAASTAPQKAAASAAVTAAAGKASSMFGGLSKGIKGGLDGVLSGVGATITDTKQQQQQQKLQEQPQQSSKKSSFTFGLASKLVPNVGGLLTSATSLSVSNKQQQQQQHQQIQHAVTSNNSSEITTAATLSTIAAHEYDDFLLPPTTSSNASSYDYYASSVLMTNDSTPTNEYTNINSTAATTYAYIMQQQDDDLAYTSSKGLLYTNGGSGGSHYNADDDMLLNPGLMMYDKIADNELDADILLMQKQQHRHQRQQQQYDFDDKYYDEYDAYSEYSYDKPLHTLNDIVVVTTASGEIIATTTAINLQQYQDFQLGKIADAKTTAASVVTTSSGQSLAKKTTSSLLSSLTNAVQLSQTQQAASSLTTTIATPAATKTTSSSGGGMFGSFLGKAAAAVQSATQVVNQGASMATAVVQKVPAAAAAAAVAVTTTTATTSANAASTTTTAAYKTTVAAGAGSVTTTSTTGYDLILHNDYNNQLLTHQDSLSSQYSTTGDDYENSNLIVYTTSPSFINHRNDKQYINYYSNGNQSQLKQQQQQTKILPTVPPVGSTGKKLPTINGKSGFLMKQQPTEIFDLDDNIDDLDLDVDIANADEDELIDVVGHEPNYRIDSEQNDYYLDHQPTTPSGHATMPANGYYEHTNGGYDYREDYFNEEDEYKYLEKEEAQKAQDELLYQQQQQQQHGKQSKPMLHEKQLSLEYCDDVHDVHDDDHIDNYIDDTYPSEDSGNYLDESSSGSVGMGVGASVVVSTAKSKGELPTDAILPATAMSSSSSSATAAATARVTLASIMQSSSASTSAVTTVFHQQIKKQDSIIMEEDEDDLCGLNDISAAGLSRKSSNILLDDDKLTDLPSSIQTHPAQTKKRGILMRGETEEVVGGHMLQMIRKPEVTAKQRWHWAYNKIIMQLNVSIKFNSI